MLTKMNHAQTIAVKRDGEVVASVTGTWWHGRGWYYLRKHPKSQYVAQLSNQLKSAGCTNGEINGILS